MFHVKKSDNVELLSCDRYVNKRFQSVFYTKKLSPLLLIYVKTVDMQQLKDLRSIIRLMHTFIWESCMKFTS